MPEGGTVERTSAVAPEPAPEPAPDADAPADGRAARAQRTQTVIVDALRSLLEEGDLRPTANRIAERAGISLRLIYHHFGDGESLFRAMAEREAERLDQMAEPIDPRLPLPDRIDALVAQRARLLEWISPVRRAAVLQEPFSHEILRSHRAFFTAGHDQMSFVFATELAGADDATRSCTVDALQAVAAWGMWNDLRLNGRTFDQAQAAMHVAVSGIMAALVAGPSTP